MFIGYLTTVNLLRFAATGLSAALTGVLFTNAILNDLKNYLIEINENGIVEENHVQATKQLCDFIQTDTLVKQLTLLFQTYRSFFIRFNISFQILLF